MLILIAIPKLCIHTVINKKVRLISTKRLIVVVGMHRSGTSTITRSLQVMGVELDDNLMPPAADNEKGFWEDCDLNALNIEMLSVLGKDWFSFFPVTAKDLSAETIDLIG